MIRFLFLTLLFASRPLLAKMEYLPNEGKTPEEVVQEIAKVLPWSEENSTRKIFDQLSLVRTLVEEVPNYQQLAEDKPGPFVVTISKRSPSMNSAPLLDRGMFVPLRESLQRSGLLQDLMAILERDGEGSALQLMVESLEKLLADGADRAQGILIGIANSQSEELKRKIFSAGGPNHQLAYLRSNPIDEASLRAKFDPQRAGLSVADIRLEALLEEVEKSLGLQLDVIANLTLLAAFTEHGFTVETIKRVEGDLEIANQHLFRFMAANSEFNFAKVMEVLKSAPTRKNEELIRKLASVKKNVEADYFEINKADETFEKYLTLYEVHPYLGIYRGCIGGDCSTTSSWSFPYSPYEHVFYIFENNTPVGYITMTRLETLDGLTLYVKDISGAKLTPGAVHAIVNILPQLKTSYGAKQVTLATSTFTTVQNHFDPIKKVLGEYDNRGPDFDKNDLLKNEFKDKKIREVIKDASDLSGAYDDPEKHKQSVRIQPNPSIVDGLRVTLEPGTLPVFQPASTKEALLLALRQMTLDPNIDLDSFAGLNASEARYLFVALNNPGKTSINNYLLNLEPIFESLKIKLTKRFIEENQSLFWRGHLIASDSFWYGNDNNIRDSFRYLLAVIRRGHDFHWLAEVIADNTTAIDNHEGYQDLVKTMQERATARDFDRILFLMDKGSQVAHTAFFAPNLQSYRESLLLSIIRGELVSEAETTFVLRAALAIKDLTKKDSRLPTDKLRRTLDSLRTDFGIEGESARPEIKLWFAQFEVFDPEVVEQDSLLLAKLNNYIDAGLSNKKAFVEFMVRNRIWERQGVDFDFRTLLEERLSGADGYMAHWALYEAGDKDSLEYLVNHKAALVEFFQSYLERSDDPTPGNFSKAAPFGNILRPKFRELFAATVDYTGSWPENFQKMNLAITDFWNTPGFTEGFFVRHFSEKQTNSIHAKMIENDEFRRLIFHMLTEGFAQTDYRSNDNVVDLLVKVFTTNVPLAGRAELRASLRPLVRDRSITDYWWQNHGSSRLVSEGVYAHSELNPQSDEDEVDPAALAMRLGLDLNPNAILEIPVSEQLLMLENIKDSNSGMEHRSRMLSAAVLAAVYGKEVEVTEKIVKRAAKEDDLQIQMYLMLAIRRDGVALTKKIINKMTDNIASSGTQNINPELLAAFESEVFSLDTLHDQKRILKIANRCEAVSNFSFAK